MKLFLFLAALAIPKFTCAQHSDSLAAARKHPFLHAVAGPVLLVGAGLAVKGENERIQKHFYDQDDGARKTPRTISDYTQFVPIVLVYAFNASGNKGEHKILKATSLALQSEVLMILMVTPLKHAINETRPNGGSYSFPSGHTAQAFMAATFLHKEYGSKSIWYSIGGYTMASAVGTCRMLGNKHWASDVLAGAGIGILSTNLVYLYHKHRNNKKLQVTAMPSYNRGPGFFLQVKL
ncbi:MAG TPA: phosphatase PAP2 family protein [Cyclobacteriaceae bacterium]